MRLFEILIMAVNIILLITILFRRNSHSVSSAELVPEAGNPWDKSSEAVNPGTNNYWARNSWVLRSQPVNQKTRNIAAGIILPVLSMVFAMLSILSEGFRLFMAPAYLLSIIFLIHGIIKAIQRKSAAYEAAAASDTAALSAPESSKKQGNRIPETLGTVFLILIFTISVASAFLFPVINLPNPTGSSPVGTTLMAFTDASRKETHTDSGESRKIPVQIWYPASDNVGEKRVNWLNSNKMSKIFAECKHVPDIFGQLNLIKTNSYLDTGLSADKEKYPVILFSGGGAMFNGQNVIQMEELASHGYIVCAVGHPYDDFACIYPDGSILPYDPGHLDALGNDIDNALTAAKKKFSGNDNHPAFNGYVLRNCRLNNEDVHVWSEDMSFVADELVRLNSGDTTGMEDKMGELRNMFTGKLDMSNLGIFGHSFGGAAAGETCLHDKRFKAFINMDGAPFGSAVNNVIRQPFMILTVSKNIKKIISGGYSTNQKNFMTVYIEGAEHMNFSDFNTILPNIGKLSGMLGSINADRQRVIMNDYILAFFNKHLKGVEQPIIDNAASKYPEVTVEKR